jgi:hypothetical protein
MQSILNDMYRSHLGTTTDWAVSFRLLSAVAWSRCYADPSENGRGHSVGGSSSEYTPWKDTMIVNNEAERIQKDMAELYCEVPSITIPEFAWRNWGKTHVTLIRVAGIPNEIRTWMYVRTNLLGGRHLFHFLCYIIVCTLWSKITPIIPGCESSGSQSGAVEHPSLVGSHAVSTGR